MSTFEVEPVTLTDEQKAQISSDGTGIIFYVEYDDSSSPEGYQIVAEGPLGKLICCAKPCRKVLVNS